MLLRLLGFHYNRFLAGAERLSSVKVNSHISGDLCSSLGRTQLAGRALRRLTEGASCGLVLYSSEASCPCIGVVSSRVDDRVANYFCEGTRESGTVERVETLYRSTGGVYLCSRCLGTYGSILGLVLPGGGMRLICRSGRLGSDTITSLRGCGPR